MQMVPGRSSNGWAPAALSDAGFGHPVLRYLCEEEGDSMKKLIKIVFILAFAGAVAAVVASVVSKKKLSSMSDDEIRAFLESKLAGKVGEDQLFYLMSRGLTEDQATSMVVAGFIEPIIKELPMEYAVEMNRLIELNMLAAGAVG